MSLWAFSGFLRRMVPRPCELATIAGNLGLAPIACETNSPPEITV